MRGPYPPIRRCVVIEAEAGLPTPKTGSIELAPCGIMATANNITAITGVPDRGALGLNQLGYHVRQTLPSLSNNSMITTVGYRGSFR